MIRPSQRLWSLLLEISTREDLEIDLADDPDFRNMRGGIESRFVEWIYTMREQRALVDRLRKILRPSDARRLANKAGVSREAMEGLDPAGLFHLVLERLGIPEPRPAGGLFDGVEQLQALRDAMNSWMAGEEVEPPIDPARRGTERLLKLIVRFLWDSGQADILRDVAQQGLQGFSPREIDQNGRWLDGLDIGSSSYLLRAFELERQERERPLPFLMHEEVWTAKTHRRFLALADALNADVHDRSIPERQRRERQEKAVRMVCELIDDGELAIPRTVRFFRRYQDGPVYHLEGYSLGPDGKPECLQFFEVEGEFDFRCDHMFLAATNPSAVNASIIELVPSFMEPV